LIEVDGSQCWVTSIRPSSTRSPAASRTTSISGRKPESPASAGGVGGADHLAGIALFEQLKDLLLRLGLVH
jgi:hypothetical protein